VADQPYVEARNGNYYVRGSQVSLESIILPWLQGQSPEDLQRAFPTLKLAPIYGAITAYLQYQVEMDAMFTEIDPQYAQQRAAAEAADPRRFARMRQRMAEARKRLESASRSAAL
jgi:uncharacterized protein (DUF433 family)